MVTKATTRMPPKKTKTVPQKKSVAKTSKVVAKSSRSKAKTVAGKKPVVKKAAPKIAVKPVEKSLSVGLQEVMIPISKIKFDPTQPRKTYHALDGQVDKKDLEYIEGLAASIANGASAENNDDGLIHPITVQENDDGTYLLVAGECRTRAHILIRRTVIRAVIKNNIKNRLAFQIAENIHHKSLTDIELFESVQELLKSGNNDKPMNKVEVAQALGVKPDFITRILRYGDAEVQRLWIEPGIVTLRESVYLVTTLPMSIQVEILRRVGLPEDDPQYLAKPLTREVIDRFRAQARQLKEANAVVPLPHDAGSPAGQGAENAAHGVHPIDAAMQGGGNAAPDSSAGSPQYTMSPELREKLLATKTESTASGTVQTPAEMRKPAVQCRITLQNAVGLLKTLEKNKESELYDVCKGMICEIIMPNSAANGVANMLSGFSVAEEELGQVLQNNLIKLK